MSSGSERTSSSPMRRTARFVGQALLGVWVFGGSLFFFLRFFAEFARSVSLTDGVARILDGCL